MSPHCDTCFAPLPCGCPASLPSPPTGRLLKAKAAADDELRAQGWTIDNGEGGR